MMDDSMMGGMWMGWFFGALLLVGLGLLVVVLVKAFAGNSVRSDSPDTVGGRGARSGRSLEIVQERYARGELSAEEYREMRRILEDDAR
ncbi:SHOCT domain-containing protein [Janibacter alittae]|uniref:SHOCT domain-containing protein n=1 Tax=Janibacter alittae TaxID=3115209 RepID=A0ABZ2MEV9_9MICO